MNHDLIFNDGCIFGLKCPTAKSTGMATTAPDEESNHRGWLLRLYTDIPHIKTP